MENEVKDLELDELEEASGGVKPWGNGKTTLIQHTVVRGNTLSGLANRYYTSVKSIMQLNPIIKNKNLIVEGWILTIRANDRTGKVG